ncbi:hypothetical protein BDN70DRAFT_845950 [Pholiota conissans]|uniref:Uncharacterized protein n=1 Tax=Pholiota conissans TaxID=109636 RepID=A0A9P5YJC2_9AGAR|nr:hypothetical protein BDN70DRAFT_845950 [Pholiota conissans]
MDRPLVDADYVFITDDDVICIGQVLAMYSKTGGANFKNEWVSSTTNISAVTKIAVQVFEYSHGCHSTSKPTKTAILSVHQFAHLPSSNVLTLLLSKPRNINDTGLDLSENDIALFRRLDTNDGRAAIKEA